MGPPTFWRSFADCRYDWGNSADRIFELGDQRFEAVEFANHGWTFVRCSRCAVHHDGNVIAADGACRNNGRPDAAAARAAAVGVYVGDGSAYNFRAPLHHDYFRLAAAPATNQRAELLAGIRALQTARDICDRECHFGPVGVGLGRGYLRQVVVKCDSAYVVRGASEWLRKWRRTGFRNARGQRLVNGDLFEELDELVFELNGRGVTVLFWLVPRASNGQADQLANCALDEPESSVGTPRGSSGSF